MTDKELLEYAAKAAGIECDNVGPYVERATIQSEFGKGNWIEEVRYDWNPLTDDGDALRLAVKLKLDYLYYMETNDDLKRMYESDPYAATRRAITRAAAEIGRAMK